MAWNFHFNATGCDLRKETEVTSAKNCQCLMQCPIECHGFGFVIFLPRINRRFLFNFFPRDKIESMEIYFNVRERYVPIIVRVFCHFLSFLSLSSAVANLYLDYDTVMLASTFMQNKDTLLQNKNHMTNTETLNILNNIYA